MPKGPATPEHLFDRTWRPGHPFRPRISRARRWSMGFVLVLLCALICGYWYITDSRRVRAEAESYLSTLLGGHVKVASATLSIFQGLKLDDVKLTTDRSGKTESLLFSAQSFNVQVDFKALLAGRLEASRIVAVEPRIHLAEDAATGERNYNRLLESHSQSGRPQGPPSTTPLVLPEIVLRNAQIQYTRHLNGQVVDRSAIAVEGQLTPLPASKVYKFSLQSRSAATEIGPVISGEMVMGTGQVNASLQNLPFDTDLKTMLPPEVRRWWEQHGLSGRVNIPVLNFIPPTTANGKAGYRVEIELQGVTLVAHPEEWMSADEHRTLQDVHAAFDVLRMAGLNGQNFVDRVAELVEPAPISLRQVHGRFVFSDDETIQIDNLHGWLEEMPFKITGKIKGYSPSAVAQIRVASSEVQDIEIPAVPRYINSLPPAVREVYDRFKPRGVCRFWVDLNRSEPGARPVVTGEITIVDGNFTFERFPYPLRKATGRIILGTNARGEESLRLDHIRGRGLEGGPNANSFVEVDGSIGPFGPDAEVKITVRGDKVSNEPALMAAFPPMTRKALTLFDAPGKGEFPKFTGDFICDIIRIRGVEPRWIIETGIHLIDASGSLAAFPYPMSGVRGDMKILDDHIEMSGITMRRGDATLRIDGKVSWPSSDTPRGPNEGPTLKPDLKIVATNVPIDSDLLNALPNVRSAWLRKVGAGGLFDLEGTIRPSTQAGGDMDFDLRLSLHDGTLWPVDGLFAVSGVRGNLRLSNQRLVLEDIRGKRGDAELSARGEIAWPTDIPQVSIRAQATNLVLEPTLYKLLPDSAKAAIDQVRPQGTIDVAMTYSGEVTEQTGAATQPAGGYEITITPRTLSLNPLAVPYQLDQVAGSVTILPDRVQLKDLAAKHGDARVRLSGTGRTGKQQVWDFALSGQTVAVDDDLKRALPKSLSGVIQSMQLAGKLNFDFTKLRVTFPEGAGTGQPGKAEVSPDLDFAVRLGTDAASLDVGVPMSEMKGALTLEGSSRNGKLSGLKGKMEMESFMLAARPVTRFSAELVKEADRDQVTIKNIQAQIAKGTMAGQIDYAFADNSPSRYAVGLKLRNADVRELAGETEQEIRGLLSASLDVDGTADQPNSRRGRGDVLVTGERMYKIPLVLGLLQITNLALPITSPFNEGTARYSIDGSKVTFEQIELRSPQMLMQGNGNLDFNTRQVKMRFVADSTAWPKLPVIADLLAGARGELLQIQVKGTLQEPKVSARSMNTLSTTVDEILGGDGKPATQASGR